MIRTRKYRSFTVVCFVCVILRCQQQIVQMILMLKLMAQIFIHIYVNNFLPRRPVNSDEAEAEPQSVG
jgi:hypothetical protein